MIIIDSGYEEGYTLRAQELHGGHIGDIIQFHYQMPVGMVHVMVIAELRQISQMANETTLNVCSHVEDTAGDMAEFTISPETRVTVLERA